VWHGALVVGMGSLASQCTSCDDIGQVVHTLVTNQCNIVLVEGVAEIDRSVAISHLAEKDDGTSQ